MRINRRLATTLILSAIAAPALGAGKPAAIKVPTRGFNLPDWLAAEPRVPADATLAMLRELGFETIRLPVAPSFALSEGAASKVAEVLKIVTDHGFNALLDMHPDGGLDFDGDFDTAADRVDDAWRVLAAVVATTPAGMVYPELLNEPPMSPKAWGKLRDRLAATVREACPAHTLIWGPARVQGIWELDGVKPLRDTNAIAAVHYYTPMGFTHQCQNWDESPLSRIKNLPFPATRKSPEVVELANAFETAGDQEALDYLNGEFQGAWSVKHIEQDFANLAKWAKKNKSAVMLNEFGVLNFCVDPVSRANWVRAVREAAEKHNVGWTYWEADQGFGFIADRDGSDVTDSSMVEALLA